MTDRDALIERMTAEADFLDKNGSEEFSYTDQGAAQLAADLRAAVISLASPSPAQTDRDALKPMVASIIRGWELPPEGQRIGPGTARAIKDADIKTGAIMALLAPSPAQWPEDVVERACDGARSVMPGAPPTWAEVAPEIQDEIRKFIRGALATLPPPEDERVKGLVTALETAADRFHEYGALHMAAYLTSALASYRGGA